MRDPLVLRILGMLLFVLGAAAIGYDSFIAYDPATFPTWFTRGGWIGALVGTLLIIFSAFFRKGHEGLRTTVHRRTGKPSAIKRMALFWGGLFLVIISPLVGAIPGPGGIFVFAAGFGMMLKGSRRVKKWFVRFKKRHPAKGAWADFGLQRGSYKRRQARLKAEQAAAEGTDGAPDLEAACKN